MSWICLSLSHAPNNCHACDFAKTKRLKNVSNAFIKNKLVSAGILTTSEITGKLVSLFLVRIANISNVYKIFLKKQIVIIIFILHVNTNIFPFGVKILKKIKFKLRVTIQC